LLETELRDDRFQLRPKRTVADQQKVHIVERRCNLGEGTQQHGVILHRMKPRDDGDVTPIDTK